MILNYSFLFSLLYWLCYYKISICFKFISVYCVYLKTKDKYLIPYMLGDIIVEILPLHFCIPLFIIGNLIKLDYNYINSFYILLHLSNTQTIYIYYIISHLLVLHNKKQRYKQLPLIISDIIILLGSYNNINTKIISWPLYYTSILI